MRYEDYKKVDLPWVEEVPSHWEIERAKFYISSKKEINKDKKIMNVLSLTLNGVIRNDAENPIGLSPSDYSTYQIFNNNDLVFKLIDLDNIRTSRVGLVNELGIMSSAYIRGIINNNILFPKYIYYWYYKLYIEEVYNKLGNGVRSTISSSELLEMQIPIPPKEEQEQIARFLDWKINEIDRLVLESISKQNYLLNIWEKILNSYLEEGEEIALKYLVDSNLRSLSDKDVIDTIKYIEISDVGYGFLKSSPKRINYKDAPSRARRLVKTDNIIISTVRTYLKSIYKIKESEKDCVVSTGFSVLEAKNDVNTDYLYLKLSTQKFLDEVQRNSIGMSYPAISDSKLLSLKISFEKDLNKQNIITDKLINIKKKVRRLLDLENEKINNLKQLKQSLISDLVTGKIDVRNVDIPDYDKVSDVVDEENLEDDFDKEE